MPLPLTVSCFSKIQIGFTFLVPARPGRHGKRAVKRASMYVNNGKKLTRKGTLPRLSPFFINYLTFH